jgi:glycerophosphoryl diester phosphodiesterase
MYHRFFSLLLLGCSLGWAVTAQAFDAQGHRGARGLAPENTLAGIEQALAVGVSTLEIDVVLSAEGVPVLSHDTAPNPDITRDASGEWLKARGEPFYRLGLNDIARFDVGRINPGSRYAREWADQEPRDGERIPTLAAVFGQVDSWSAAHVGFNIELKLSPLRPDESPRPADFVRAVLDVVKRHGMASRVTLQSFDWRVLQEARRQAPALQLSYLSSQRRRFDTLSSGEWTHGLRLGDFEDAPAMVAAAGGRLWSPQFQDLSQATMARARSLKLRVIPWTVNESADMERLIDWGVDGLITDYPDRLRAVMQRRGLALPPQVVAPARHGTETPEPPAITEPAPFGVAPDLR